MNRHRTLSSAALVVMMTGAAHAQEAIHTPAATQPAEGNLYLRQKFMYQRLGRDPSPENRDLDKVVSSTMLSYGLRRDLSLTLNLPLEYDSSRSAAAELDRSFGVNDIDVSLKWRPLQWDLGPVDSVRVAFTAGLEIPTYDGGFSSRGWDPSMGVIFTSILGRHGFNQSLRYKFNTNGQPFPTRAGDGEADALFYDSAYLFRLSPAEYTADTEASTYLTLELNGLYETNGDIELLFSPGILYEAREFALEAGVGVPIVRDVHERPSADFVVTFGLRILF